MHAAKTLAATNFKIFIFLPLKKTPTPRSVRRARIGGQVYFNKCRDGRDSPEISTSARRAVAPTPPNAAPSKRLKKDANAAEIAPF
jgi:hypothetical protein